MRKFSAILLTATTILMLALVSGLLFIINQSSDNLETPPELLDLFPECQGPCWQGIMLEETTMNEAQSLLQNSFNLSNTYSGYIQGTWQAQNRPLTLQVGINSWQGTPQSPVMYMDFMVVSGRLYIQDVIHIFGSPDGVVTNDDYYNNRCSINVLVYEDRQIIVQPYIRYPSSTVNLHPLERVSNISIVNSQDFSQRTNTSGGYIEYIEWKGYGSYCK